jgi:hypothetical protein
VREQVEALEHHPDVASLRGRGTRMKLVQSAAALGVPDKDTVDVQTTAVDDL